jgi:hypothetical protein
MHVDVRCALTIDAFFTMMVATLATGSFGKVSLAKVHRYPLVLIV